MRNAASEYLTANPGAFLPIGIFFGIGCLVCLCVGVRAVITRRERKSAREIRQGMRRGDNSKDHKGAYAVFSGLVSLFMAEVAGSLCAFSLLEYSAPGTCFYNESDRENEVRDAPDFGDQFRKTAPRRSVPGLLP